MTGDEGRGSDELARLRAIVDGLEQQVFSVAAMGFAAGLELGLSKRQQSDPAVYDDAIAKLLVDRASTTNATRQSIADVGIALVEQLRAEAVSKLNRSTTGEPS